MPAIVTMDSTTAVLSPSGRVYEPEDSELVQEAFHFCLDGTVPQLEHGNSHSNHSTHPSHPSLPQQGSTTNPQHELQFLVKRGMSENEHSTGTSSTGCTSSTMMASPAMTLHKNPLPWGYTQEQQQRQQHHDTMAADDDLDDFYSGQQSPMLTPPTHPSEEEKGIQIPPQATAVYVNITRGTPPASLYQSEQSEGQQEQQQQDQQAPNSTSSNNASNAADEHSSSNDTRTSPASPAFPMDGIAPVSSFSHKHPKPVLYSAIGSLENCSAHSLKSMWDKNKQQQPEGRNGFAVSKYDSSQLIAPESLLQPQHYYQIPNQQQQQHTPNQNKKSSPGVDATPSERSTPDKFGDRQQNTNECAATPGAIIVQHHHNQSSAFKDSLRSMNDKLDAHNRERYGNAVANNAHINHRVSMMLPQTTSATIAATTNNTIEPKLKQPKASSMRKGRSSTSGGGGRQSSKNSTRKSVTIEDASLQRKQRKPKKPVEMFRPSCDAYTPKMERKKIAYKPAEMRTPVQKMGASMGTLSRPNFRDALRRVAMLLRQHIVKIEQRFAMNGDALGDEGLFKTSMKDAFSEERFATCRYKCTVVRVPMARPGMVFGMKKIRPKFEIPSEEEIYEFAHQLFQTVQLSSECSIVCLIYIERLMEASKVPLLANTWKPIFLCGLLLASKVWQDLSSWNIEFASVYPQFSLDAINKLELQFLRMVKWDLYISSSLYAKYYFALRSLVEKPGFRQRYNRMVGGVDSVAASEALKIQKRTEQVKEEALINLSRSM